MWTEEEEIPKDQSHQQIKHPQHGEEFTSQSRSNIKEPMGELDHFEDNKVPNNLEIDAYSGLPLNSGFKEFERTINSMMEKLNNLWYCTVCRKEFNKKTHLMHRVERFHTEGFTHSCELCGKIPPTRNALRQHRIM